MNPLHPYGGPEPRSDVCPLTDDAEVRECRRILYSRGRGCEPDWLSEVEVFGTMDEAAFARDLELWGEAPFDLD